MPETEELDFDAAYTVDGYRGIAWHIIKYKEENVWPDPIVICDNALHEDNVDHEEECYAYPEEPDIVVNKERVIAIMVGDDRRFEFGVDELTKIDEDDYCSICGQVGCTADKM